MIKNAVAKGSFFFKGQEKLLLINAKGQFSQTHTYSPHFLTHPALSSDRSMTQPPGMIEAHCSKAYDGYKVQQMLQGAHR